MGEAIYVSEKTTDIYISVRDSNGYISTIYRARAFDYDDHESIKSSVLTWYISDGLDEKVLYDELKWYADKFEELGAREFLAIYNHVEELKNDDKNKTEIKDIVDTKHECDQLVIESEEKKMESKTNCYIEGLREKIYTSTMTGNKYKMVEIEPDYMILIDIECGNKIITGWCGSFNGEDDDNMDFIVRYEKNTKVSMYARLFKTVNAYLETNIGYFGEDEEIVEKDLREQLVWLAEKENERKAGK